MRPAFRFVSRGFLAALAVFACLGGIAAAQLAAAGVSKTGLSAASYQGFGASTVGGDKGRVVEVTSVDDDGPGTLRQALAGGDRRIVFRVGGTISLKTPLLVREPNITIDGEDAPAPGITIRDRGVSIRETHDVIVRHIRVRGSSDDNFSISGACRNIVIDHCSSTGATDGAIDIVHDYKRPERKPRDITISWCVLADTPHAMLLATSENLSLHHNLVIGNDQRSPQLRDVRVFDLRNNVITLWGSYGARIRGGSKGNVVNNVFGPPMAAGKSHEAALVVMVDTSGARSSFPPQRTEDVYVAGNLGPSGNELHRSGSAADPIAAPVVDTLPSAQVVAAVLAGAGARPLDETDSRIVERVRR